ncbi:hypothetical protein [Halalkalibacter flavus]|uniref:hypothetical protein n=1 Tax=Halalkalibacter flavus TaxID=3090668 RepID=UPI002FC9581E
MIQDMRLDKALKAFRLAGLNPTTPEEKTAYRMAMKLMTEIEGEKPVFGGYLGRKRTAKELLWDSLNTFKDAFIFSPKTISIPWDKFYLREEDQFAIYEITPTSSVRNNQAFVLAKVMASFYRKPSELKGIFRNGSLYNVKSPYRCNFRVVMKADGISFYLLLPTDKEGEIVRKAESIWDTGITIQKVEALPKLDPSKVFCTELGYRKHDIFSLATDKDNNYPLPSLLTTVRTLEGEDVAIFDAMFEPYDRVSWFKEAKEAHNLLDRGYIPNNSAGTKLLRTVHSTFDKLRYELLELTRFTKEQKEALEKWRKEESSYKEAARVREEMKPATKRKQGDEILKAWLRIAVESDNAGRARDAAYSMANAWKDITGDNELERFDVPVKWNEKYLDAIETRKGFSIRLKPNKMSADEAGKFMQLPGRDLIKEFPQINSTSLKQSHLPEELTRDDIKSVRIGYVKERGKEKLARLPLEAFEGVSQKAVYDSLCTSTFGQGKQGSGKSEGFGTVWAYDMVMAGFTVILVDTADGQVLRNFVNSLPADFPEEKIHALNFDNKSWAIPLGWEDIYGRDFAGTSGDAELAALEISERITSRFVGFINSLSSTGEFTDRMKQYVVSCMRAITTRPRWSFIDLEMALTSPAYRAELLDRAELKDMPEVLADLEALQEKAKKGSISSVVDPILSRIKVLSSTQFMANLFYQEPKLDDEGKPVLDMRKLMDNEEGGYGHVVVVQASHDAWQENQATILGFFEDKVNFNAFSRIDVDQSQRKPVLKWIDEPHKVIKAIEGRLSGTSVEFRKYRVKNLFTGHSIDQMGAAADALLDGGAQITSYKTERLSELKRFAHNFQPYDDPKELHELLPEKHVAINAVRLPSGKTCPAFIADMVAPPKQVKDRSHVWQASSERYGRPWKEVRETIQEKRKHYKELDDRWYAAIEEEKEQKKRKSNAK